MCGLSSSFFFGKSNNCRGCREVKVKTCKEDQVGTFALDSYYPSIDLCFEIFITLPILLMVYLENTKTKQTHEMIQQK